MFRLLRIRVSGFRSLSDDFAVSFLTNYKVSAEDFAKQVVAIDKRLNGFRTMAVVGANSSGKSTFLRAAIMGLNFLRTGRFPFRAYDFASSSIRLGLDFYLDGFVYFYSVVLEPPDMAEDESPLVDCDYALIKEERLRKMAYVAHRGNRILDFEERASDVTNKYLSKSLRDTSAIPELFPDPVSFDFFTTNAVSDFYSNLLRKTVYEYLKNADPRLLAPIIELLDDSVEKIVPRSLERVTLKKKGKPGIEIRASSLGTFLSTGTLRGIELFLRAYSVLKAGTALIVDEIENSFHKDIVENLIFLFNDIETNPKGAMLLFSTHLSETLDLLKRTDSIYVMHRKKDKVYPSNLKSEYRVRSGLLMSHQLDNGIFDTAVNYEHVMNLRRAFIAGT